MTATHPLFVIISHYAARDKAALQSLVRQIRAQGLLCAVAINDDLAEGVSEEVLFGVPAVRGPNRGMNLGAWQLGFHHFKGHEAYLFLQDECEIRSQDFAQHYVSLLADPTVGLAGESINLKWDRSWNDVAASPLNYPLFNAQGQPVIDRVSFYLACFKHWDIQPGTSARHLRSLVWGLRAETMNLIGGFPIGLNKEECIAAEIGVSKKVESTGLRVVQSAENPFNYIGHREWSANVQHKIAQLDT